MVTFPQPARAGEGDVSLSAFPHRWHRFKCLIFVFTSLEETVVLILNV